MPGDAKSASGELVQIGIRSQTVEQFLGLSVALTGFSRVELLGTGMLERYYDTVNLIIGEREMGKLLTQWMEAKERALPGALDEVVRELLLENFRYGPVARRLIRLWYLGAWSQLPQEWRNAFGATSYDVAHIVSPEAYQESLVWTAGEAHPMGAKQQGFGTWAAPGPSHDEGKSQ